MVQVVFYGAKRGAGGDLGRSFLPGCGGRWAEDLGRLETGLPAFYGVKPASRAVFDGVRAEGRGFLYIDNAYIGYRRFYRVTWDAEQVVTPDPQGCAGPDRDRLKATGATIEPWQRTRGDAVLVATQSPYWYARHGTTLGTWLKATHAAIGAATGRPIRVRVKPRFGSELADGDCSRQYIAAWEAARGGRQPSLEEDLAAAWCVVTHSSAIAIEAVLRGIPAFCTEACAASAFAPADLSRIDTPAMGEGREDWAALLAANQWTKDEMRDGTCWRALRAMQDRPAWAE